MAGSTPKTVNEIFQTMEYGPTTSSNSTAQAWLTLHSHSLGLFINGHFVQPGGTEKGAVADASGQEVCTVACASDDDINMSVTTAAVASKVWNGLSCHERGQILRRLGVAIQRHAQCLTELCELSRSPSPVSALVRLAQYYSAWAQMRDAQIPGWSPLGVVAVFISDDCSLYALLQKALPALAMGNAVILKPGCETVLPALLLASIGMEAGLPAGILNVIMGQSQSLAVKVAQNENVSCITFSGNKEEAQVLSKGTAGYGIPVFLSLSPSAVCPFIIFESADIDSAVDGVIEAAFKKKRDWQWVLCVQETVWDSVFARLKIRMATMKCLPLVAETDRRTVDTAVQDAQQQGATVLQPCSPPASSLLYPPTVLWGVAPSCPCVVSPAPGPVLPALSFRSAAEGVTVGNHSPHGQAASVWTEDLALALESARSLTVGSVWINSHSALDPSLPVSGTKESGTCTDGGREGLFQFLRPSLSPSVPPCSPVCINYATFGSSVSSPPVPQGTTGADQSRCAQFVVHTFILLNVVMQSGGVTTRTYLQLVGGRQSKSDSGCSIPVVAPDGNVLAYCPDSGRKDVRDAVEAAIKVQQGWMKKSPVSRSQSLYSLAESLEQKRRDMAMSLMAQTGLSQEDAEEEVDLSISRLFCWAAHCEKEGGGVQCLLQSGFALSLPEPIGVVGVVLPDTRPLLSLVCLLGASVAAGNAAIMVSSEKNPLPALKFIQVLQSSDIPGGVVSILTGHRDQLTQALANHSVIQAIWYWGTQKGCQYLQQTCSAPPKRLWLHREDEGKEGDSGGVQAWAHPHPSFLDDVWMHSIRWKSVWIPTA